MIVLGGGDLGTEFGKYFNCEPWSSSYLDLSSRESIDSRREEIKNTNDRRMIITSGIFHSDDIWQMMMVNYVGIAYLLDCIQQDWEDGHVIVVGSISARWTAWPGIPRERIFYNIPKEAISHHVAALNQQGIQKVRFSCIDPGRL